MDVALERSTLLFSALWLILALPFHSGRLAAIWLRAHRALYEQRLALKMETLHFAAFLAELERSEQQIAQALIELQSQEDQRQAVLGHRATVARLGEKFAAAGEPEPLTPQAAA
jgi:hypothetical protein